MSCTMMAARSAEDPETAILNLRGRKENSGCSVDHCRRISDRIRGSSISSADAAAKGSAVIVGCQLPPSCEEWLSTTVKSNTTHGNHRRPTQQTCLFFCVEEEP